MAEPLEEPTGGIARDELADDPPRVGEILEPIEIQALLLERAHEALDDAIALRLPDVGRRDRHAEPLHLVDPRIGDVLRPPVAPDPQPTRDVLGEAAEGVAYALAQRLERGPAIADLRGVPADKLVETVVDGPEEPAPPVLFGVEARGVGAPHLVRSRGRDRAGVGGIAIRGPQAARRQ